MTDIYVCHQLYIGSSTILYSSKNFKTVQNSLKQYETVMNSNEQFITVMNSKQLLKILPQKAKPK